MIIDFFEYGNGSGGGLNIVFLTEDQTDEHGVPTIENPDTKSIYFAKPKPVVEGDNNIYNEWVWIKKSKEDPGQWELFGSASVNIKDLVRKVNGMGPDSTGNVVVTANQKFLDTFVMNSTTQVFCESVKTYGQLGMSYIGPLSCTDLPSGLANGEAVVEVIGTSLDPNGKVIHIYLYSTTTSPYAWEYSYYTSSMKSGWTYYNGYTKTEVDNLLNGKADKATTLAGYNIGDAKIENGTTIVLGSNSISPVKTVNSIAPTNGNVNITTFSDVPSSMNPYKTGTLENFCIEFLTKVNPAQGSAYLTSGIAFTNLPKSFFDHGSPGCEMFIYIPMRSGNNIVYNLEITTTNCFEEQWYGGPGKWMAICQVENGSATLHMPWQGMLGCPQQDKAETDGKHKYVPTKDYHSVSKYWLDKQLSSKADDSVVVKTVNGYEPVSGAVTVPTNNRFPSDMVNRGVDMEYSSTAEMCRTLYKKHGGDPNQPGYVDYAACPGACFLGKLYAQDNEVTQNGTDIILQVIKDGLYHIDMYSTDPKDGCHYWHTMFYYPFPGVGYDGLSFDIVGLVERTKLNDYVEKTTTIAGNALTGNISADMLLGSILNSTITSNGVTKSLQEWIDTISAVTENIN